MIAHESWLVADKAAWAARPGRDVTGSVISVLFDCHQHGMAAEQLVRQIRGEWRPYRNAAMAAGRALERAFPEALGELHPDWRVEKCRHYHRLPEHRLAAVADFWLDNDGVIEAKTVSARQWAKWGGKPLLAYLLQIATEMLCADRARGVLAVMIRVPSAPLFLFDIPRIGEVDERLIEATTDWWTAFGRGEIAPAADASGLAELLLPEIDFAAHTARQPALPPSWPSLPPSLPSALAAAGYGALAAGRLVLASTGRME